MELGLSGRVALVCGSTRGLGRAVAKLLAQEGARVAINGRKQETVDQAVRELDAETGRAALGIAGDVSAAGEPDRIVNQVHHELGRIDILFCNAGGPPAAPFRDQPADAWQRALDANLLATVHLARAAVPLMRKHQWGRVICLTSIAAKQPLPGLILSTTARAGVLGFAKSLSDEVAPDGITVNVIAPGYIATERTVELNRTRAQRERRTSEEIAKDVISHIPVGRMGNPEELAAAAAFLASDKAGYITGAVLQVDGGYTRSIF
jgi:3-oxoacyl-[acyl-carrier protein] reductase